MQKSVAGTLLMGVISVAAKFNTDTSTEAVQLMDVQYAPHHRNTHHKTTRPVLMNAPLPVVPVAIHYMV